MLFSLLRRPLATAEIVLCCCAAVPAPCSSLVARNQPWGTRSPRLPIEFLSPHLSTRSNRLGLLLHFRGPPPDLPIRPFQLCCCCPRCIVVVDSRYAHPCPLPPPLLSTLAVSLLLSLPPVRCRRPWSAEITFLERARAEPGYCYLRRFTSLLPQPSSINAVPRVLLTTRNDLQFARSSGEEYK